MCTLNVIVISLRFAYINCYSSKSRSFRSDLLGYAPLGLSRINSIFIFNNKYELIENNLHPPNKPHPY